MGQRSLFAGPCPFCRAMPIASMNSRAVRVFFREVHERHEGSAFSMSSVPPRASGTYFSILSGAELLAVWSTTIAPSSRETLVPPGRRACPFEVL